MNKTRVSPTLVEINLKALRHNFRRLRKKLPARVGALCVVKSNAYGHGAPRVAKALQAEGAEAFGVGTVDEAVELCRAGIRRPILVLLGMCRGVASTGFEDIFRHRLTPVLYDLETAEALNRQAVRRKKRVPVHIKIDTGMTRLGVLPQDFKDFCGRLKRLTALKPQGLLTHLAEATDEGYTKSQALIFRKAIALFESFFPPDERRRYHLANSQGILDRITDPSSSAKGVRWLGRMGIALYGGLGLQPVMTWKTKIIQIKKVPAKTPVSYNRTYVTRRPSRIGVLPVGYADGYPRLLSNRASVLVKGRRAPVAGMVCMDLMMIDVTAIPEAKVGDEVILLGRQGREEILAEELGRLAETISYEIFCRVSPRVTRAYV